MVCGSYRGEDALEVYDLRMMKRSRVIPWMGTGAEELLPNEPVTDIDESDAAPVTESETEIEERKAGDTTEASTVARRAR